ncbi:hypothetical protein AB0H03_11885 [Streptomyces sparsogenes]
MQSRAELALTSPTLAGAVTAGALDRGARGVSRVAASSESAPRLSEVA